MAQNAWKEVPIRILPDEVDVEIVGLAFVHNEEYGNSVAEIQFLLPEENVVSRRYSLGKIGQPTPEGDAFVLPEPYASEGSWVGGTNWARFCTGAVQCAGDVIKQRGEPSHASTWIGTRWTLKREEQKMRDGGRYDVWVPIAFLGTTDAPAASPTATPAAAQPSASTEYPETLIKAAREASDVRAFQLAAFADPELRTNTPVLVQVANEDSAKALYEKLRSEG